MAPDKKKCDEEESRKKTEEELEKKSKKAEQPYICQLPKKRKPLSKEELREKCGGFVRSGVPQERQIKKSFEGDGTIESQSSNSPASMNKRELLAKYNAPPTECNEQSSTTQRPTEKEEKTASTGCSLDKESTDESNKQNSNDEIDSPPYKGKWNPNFQCEDFMKLNQRRILYGCDDELQHQFDSELTPDERARASPNDEKCQNLTNLWKVDGEKSKSENDAGGSAEMADVKQKAVCEELYGNMADGTENELARNATSSSSNTKCNAPNENGCMIEIKIKRKKVDDELISNEDTDKETSRVESSGFSECGAANDVVDEAKGEQNDVGCGQLIEDEAKPENEDGQANDKTDPAESDEFKCGEGVDENGERVRNEFGCGELVEDDEQRDDSAEVGCDDEAEVQNEGANEGADVAQNESECDEPTENKSEPENERVDEPNKDDSECGDEIEAESNNLQKSSPESEGNGEDQCDENSDKPGNSSNSDIDYPSMEDLSRICEDAKSSSKLPSKYPTTEDIVKMCERVSSINAGEIAGGAPGEKFSCSCDEETKDENGQDGTCFSLDGAVVRVDDVSEDIETEDYGNCPELNNSEKRDADDTKSACSVASKKSTTTECYGRERLICRRSPNPITDDEKIGGRNGSSCSTYSTATERYEAPSLISRRSPNLTNPLTHFERTSTKTVNKKGSKLKNDIRLTDEKKIKARDTATNDLKITGRHVRFLSPAEPSTKSKRKGTSKNANSNWAEVAKKTRGFDLRDICKFNVGAVPEKTSNFKIDRTLGTKKEIKTNPAEKPAISESARKMASSAVAKNESDIKLEAILKKFEELNVDRGEQNIDRSERNVDPSEQNIEPSERNIDPSEQNIDPNERNTDRGEQNIDPNERNMDRGEQNIDRNSQNTYRDDQIIRNDVVTNASSRDERPLVVSSPVKNPAIYSNYEISSKIDQTSNSVECVDCDRLAGKIIEGYVERYSPTDITYAPQNSPIGIARRQAFYGGPETESPREKSPFQFQEYPSGSARIHPESRNSAFVREDNFQNVLDSKGSTWLVESPVKEDLMTYTLERASANSGNHFQDATSLSSYSGSTASDASGGISLLKSEAKKTKIVWRQITYGLQKGEKACVIDWKKAPIIPVKENNATRVSKKYKMKNSTCFMRKSEA